MLMKWWRSTHVGIKALLVLCLVCGIGFPLLDQLLWYTDDPETVRHGANQAAGIACGQALVHTGEGWTNEQIRPVCDCVGQRFTAAFTPGEIDRLRKHKEELAPPFAITPAMQPKFDAAMSTCRDSVPRR